MNKIFKKKKMINFLSLGAIVTAVSMSQFTLGCSNQQIKTADFILDGYCQEEFSIINWPTKISNKNNSIPSVTLKLAHENSMKLTNHSFLIKVGEKTIGEIPNVCIEYKYPTTFNVPIDWTKVNSGDTVRLAYYGIPMWARIYNETVLNNCDKSPEKPTCIYAGDNAMLLGKKITYGVTGIQRGTNKNYIYFEENSIPGCVSKSPIGTAFTLMGAMYYMDLFSNLYLLSGGDMYNDSDSIYWDNSLTYGAILIFDIQYGDFIAMIKNGKDDVMAKLILDSYGRLKLLFISDYYYSTTLRNGNLSTYIKPEYYTEREAPIVEIDDGVTNEGKCINAAVPYFVQNKNASKINVNAIYSYDGKVHTGNFVLLDSNSNPIASSDTINIRPITRPNETLSIENTTSLFLDDYAREVIANETGHLKVVFEENV